MRSLMKFMSRVLFAKPHNIIVSYFMVLMVASYTISSPFKHFVVEYIHQTVKLMVCYTAP